MTVYERESVWVSKIDVDKASKLFQDHFDDPGIQAEEMAVINAKDGVATVCSEGVGWFANDEGKFLLLGFVGQFGEASMYATAEQLISIMSDEFIYLDEFVRSFGARLETNYSIWYDKLIVDQANSHTLLSLPWKNV
jgi:hypothetical protein